MFPKKSKKGEIAMWAIIYLIATVFITWRICKAMNKNTVGTTYAYVTRFFIVWVIVAAVLAVIFNKLSLF